MSQTEIVPYNFFAGFSRPVIDRTDGKRSRSNLIEIYHLIVVPFARGKSTVMTQPVESPYKLKNR